MVNPDLLGTLLLACIALACAFAGGYGGAKYTAREALRELGALGADVSILEERIRKLEGRAARAQRPDAQPDAVAKALEELKRLTVAPAARPASPAEQYEQDQVEAQKVLRIAAKPT